MNSTKTDLKVNKHDCLLAISRILDSRSKGSEGYHFVVVFLRARQYILTVSLSTKVYKHLNGVLSNCLGNMRECEGIHVS